MATKKVSDSARLSSPNASTDILSVGVGGNINKLSLTDMSPAITSLIAASKKVMPLTEINVTSATTFDFDSYNTTGVVSVFTTTGGGAISGLVTQSHSPFPTLPNGGFLLVTIMYGNYGFQFTTGFNQALYYRFKHFDSGVKWGSWRILNS